jgi:hypothetical protein
MNALHSIAAEMQRTARAVTEPNTRASGKPIVQARGVRASTAALAQDDDEPVTHIQPWMAEAFAGLVRAADTDAPFALLSCFMNGRPAAVIAYVHDEGRRKHVLPLFMAVQSGMHFTPHEDAPEEE